MALTTAELTLLLGNEEPNYAEIAAKAGNTSTAAVAELAQSKDTMMATKATYLASLLNDPEGAKIVEKASRSSNQLLRLASASALVNLPEITRNKIAERLVDTDDISLQKLSLAAIQGKTSAKLRKRVDELSTGSDSEVIRNLSKSALIKIN